MLQVALATKAAGIPLPVASPSSTPSRPSSSSKGDLPVDTLEGVSSLLDKSLLRQEEGAEGELRFVMLETIHEYARERLEASGEAEEIKRLHAEYFLALAEEAEPELSGAEQLAYLERLESEHDNFRAALTWSLEKEPETALRLAGALGRFWEKRLLCGGEQVARGDAAPKRPCRGGHHRLGHAG